MPNVTPVLASPVEVAQLKSTVATIMQTQSATDTLQAREAAIDAQSARVDRMVASAQTQLTSVRAQQTTVTELTSEAAVTLESLRAAQVTNMAKLTALEEAQTAAAKRMSDLENRIAALEARAILLSRGLATTPTLALGAKADVTIQLSRALPSAVFDVEIVLAPALVGKMTATVKSKTATAVVVTLTATVAVTVAGTVDVTAYRLS